MTIILTFFVNSGLNFVLGLLVAKFLGPEEFGRYAIAAAIATVLNATLLDWLRLSASRFYSERARRDEPTIRATLDSLVASISLGLVSLLAVAIVAGVDFRLPAALAAAAAGAGICSGLFDYHAALARARFQERAYALIVVIKNIVAFILMVGGAFVFRDASIVFAGLCLSIAAALIVTRRALADEGPMWRNTDPRLALTFLRYGMPIVVAVTIYQLLPFINRTAVAALYGYAEAGRFSLAADLGVRIFATAGSALDILLFQIAVRTDELHGREKAEHQINRNALVVLAFMLPTAAGYWLILPSFEALLVPEEFRGAFVAYSALLIPSLFAFAMIQYALNPVFQLAKGTAPVVAASAIGLAVNIALVFLLAPRFESEGFALAQSGGMLAALMASFTLASRGTRFVLPLRDVAIIVAATAIMTGVLAPFRHYEPALLALPVLIVAGAAVFMLVMTAFNVAGLRDELRARFGREAQRAV
jgi:O-antigen/teichoic acid export membrane protein